MNEQELSIKNLAQGILQDSKLFYKTSEMAYGIAKRQHPDSGGWENAKRAHQLEISLLEQISEMVNRHLEIERGTNRYIEREKLEED